jgi:hypothetical protein
MHPLETQHRDAKQRFQDNGPAIVRIVFIKSNPDITNAKILVAR